MFELYSSLEQLFIQLRPGDSAWRSRKLLLVALLFEHGTLIVLGLYILRFVELMLVLNLLIEML